MQINKKKLTKDARLNGFLLFPTYLIMPCQRIPKYNLLLRELLHKTPQGHEEYSSIETALGLS